MSSSSLAAPPERVSGNGASKPDTESGAESGAEFGAAQAESAAAAAAGVRKQPRVQRLIICIILPRSTFLWSSLITAQSPRKAAVLLWHWCCRQQQVAALDCTAPVSLHVHGCWVCLAPCLRVRDISLQLRGRARMIWCPK